MIIEKQYARRTIEGYKSPYDDPFSYRPISEFSEEELCGILDRVQQGAIARDLDDEPSKQKFEGMIQFAGSRYDPKYWMVALQDDKPVGVVFAQRYHDAPSLGSLFLVALIPEMRGKGLGKVIHAKGLELLAEMGVTKYTGSTDVLAESMIKVFVENGCELTKILKIDIGKGIVAE
jgi:GNAT superfamily N-acetyltransferase